MRNIIRIGDKTTGGGTVQSGSVVMKFCGIGVARQGDPAMVQLGCFQRHTAAHPEGRQHSQRCRFIGSKELARWTTR